MPTTSILVSNPWVRTRSPVGLNVTLLVGKITVRFCSFNPLIILLLAQTKKGRQTYQRYQTSVLESKFQQSSYVSKKQREELRLQTNLTDRQIKIWFQVGIFL
jgi:hypothetical protein